MIEFFQKLYRGNDKEFFDLLHTSIDQQKRMFLITANPEVFSRGEQDDKVKSALLDEETLISPDGEGIVKAAKMLDFEIWGKIAGVDTVRNLLAYCSNEKKSVYFYGSKQNVLDGLEKRLETEYPNIIISGMKNGYDTKEEDAFLDMIEKKPDLILVALGVPRQELAIHKYIDRFDKGLFIGVGGSLDVLSGTKKRAPKILIKCKLEWLYRLLKEPNRIGKFYDTHVKFILKIKKLSKIK